MLDDSSHTWSIAARIRVWIVISFLAAYILPDAFNVPRRMQRLIVAESSYVSLVPIRSCGDATALAPTRRPMWINGSGVNGSGKAGLLTYAAMKTHHAAALALIGW
jgi:hypothetical protein